MVSNDQELIDQVRALTDYHSDVLSDSDIQTLIDIGKEEMKADFRAQDFEFYSTYQGVETYAADRALFWFTCIACKVKAGEIGGISISVSEISASAGRGSGYEYWFAQFNKKYEQATQMFVGGIGQTTLERDGRSYGDL